ncbi:TM0106 family RecB-like putative nuclease [Cyanobacteria bacterium FACHB-63]|nr:TM0106 family RecB-like putative nuclease [Cyanobacteria bacterium FACHB-63]
MFITADLLLNYQRCSRRAFLDRYGDSEQKDPPNDYLLKLIQDSAENRRQVLSSQDHREPTYKSGDWQKGAEETLKLMRAGVERIYQPVLLAEEAGVTLVANPDLLEKQPGQSIFGDWIYVPSEIKLSKRPKQEYQIVVAYFAKVLAAVQGAWVEEAWLILKERGAFSVDLWETVPRMEAILANCIQTITQQHEPEVFISRSRCSLCHWFSHCYAIAKSEQHLSLLPGVTQPRYVQLQALNLTTLEALAETPPAQLESLPGFGSETAHKIVRQARSTLQDTALLGESLAAHTVGKRPFRMPTIPTAAIELYFDIEAEPSLNLIYLHGILIVDRINQTETFHALLAETPEEESIAWQKLIDLLWAYPNAPIFHFCPYEVQTVERLGKLFETPEELIRPLLARFVDLHDCVTQTVTLPVESYALKHIARWVGFDWRDSSANGAQSIYWYAQWLTTGDRSYLESILIYNEDDCRATYQVKEWLVDFLNHATPSCNGTIAHNELGYAV